MTSRLPFRIYKGVSQAALAKRCGVTPAHVSRDEMNHYAGVTFEKAKRVLTALGINDSFYFADPITKKEQ